MGSAPTSARDLRPKKEVDEDDSDGARLAAIRDSEERTNKKLADMEEKIDELKDLLLQQRVQSA